MIITTSLLITKATHPSSSLRPNQKMTPSICARLRTSLAWQRVALTLLLKTVGKICDNTKSDVGKLAVDSFVETQKSSKYYINITRRYTPK